MSCEHARITPWMECNSCDYCGEDGICGLCRFGDLSVPADQYKGPTHKCPETIDVCGRCLKNEHEIPLIFTFAFNGHEKWCPFCGGVYDIFGSTSIPWSVKLHNRRHRYEENFKPYLMAVSSLNCSQLMWDGKWTAPKSLPVREIDRLRDLVENGWKAGVVIL